MAGTDGIEIIIIDETQERARRAAEGRVVSFTGDPWLDGVVWARAIHINDSAVGMYLTTLPAPFIEAVMDSAEAAGLACELQEIKEHEDGVIPIRLVLKARDPVFRELRHIKGLRWLSPSFDIEFLRGYLQAIMHNAMNGLSLRPSPKLICDVKAVLDALDIPHWVPTNPGSGVIHIKSSRHADAHGIIPGFMKLVRLEDQRFRSMEESMGHDEWNAEMEIETAAMLYNRETRLNARPLINLTNEQLMAIISDAGPRSRTKRRAALRELEHRDARCLAAELADLIVARTVRNRLEEDILHRLFIWGCREELTRILLGRPSTRVEFRVQQYLRMMERTSGGPSGPANL